MAAPVSAAWTAPGGKASRLRVKRPLPLLRKHRTGLGDDDEVLAAAIEEVGEQGHRRVIEHVDARLEREILEDARGPLAVKPVGQSLRLAEVDLVAAVAIRIANAYPAIPENIDAARLVEGGAPVVRVAEQVSSIGRVTCKRRLRHIPEHSLGTLNRNHLDGTPSRNLPTRIVTVPLDLPNAGGLPGPFRTCDHGSCQLEPQTRVDTGGLIL